MSNPYYFRNLKGFVKQVLNDTSKYDGKLIMFNRYEVDCAFRNVLSAINLIYQADINNLKNEDLKTEYNTFLNALNARLANIKSCLGHYSL